MAYDVLWTDEAIDELGMILKANPRQRRFLVDDSNRIDEILASDPLGAAIDAEDGLSITQVGRLRVTYLVDPAEPSVTIVSVALTL